MKIFYKRISQVHTIIALRAIAVTVQVFLILFVNLGLDYQLPWTPLITVIVLELLFTCGSFYYYRVNREAGTGAVLAQVCADIVFLSLILYFSGGATNAFVSLLLIPISIAAVTLTSTMLGAVALMAIGSYSVLLWLLPMSEMHGNMQGHFIAMWINFLFSAIVVALVVGKMARSINERELAIAAYREDLLKQEKVISLGVASAQVTHQLATPISTVQLLADELHEDLPDNEIVNEMLGELARCRDSLASFRQMTFDIKEQTIEVKSCGKILQQIQDDLSLNYPDIHVVIENPEKDSNDGKIHADASLLPAILNLLNNGIRASRANNSNQIHMTSELINNAWQLKIRDFGLGFTLSKLAELGVKPVSSEQGLGMAVFLSHASLERLGGKLVLANHQDGGALVTLSLPVI